MGLRTITDASVTLLFNQVSFLLQEENRPVGGFSLRGSLVSALEDNGVPTGKVQLWPRPEALRDVAPVLWIALC